MGNNQNFSLEKLAEIVALPCKYRDEGCKESHVLKKTRSSREKMSFQNLFMSHCGQILCMGREAPTEPPVYQCSNGHIVCSKCREQLDTCHTCREPLGYISCLIIEQIVLNLTAPCSNAFLGCPELCTWMGEGSQFQQHLTQNHPQVPVIKKSAILFLGIDFQIPTPAIWATISECYEHQLVITVHKENIFRPSYTIKIQNLTPPNASNLEYTIKFQRGGYTLTWTSSHIPELKTESGTTHCLELPDTLIRSFCDGNNFKFSIYIAKKEFISTDDRCQQRLVMVGT
ncbi:E3 ubiquitin-protein ligase sina-like [Centruroides sculpturatus]|uniref:E3 ubiquitin-protein ligase sina-like n=1 Tax=Centruroides sculpturatus TaxID=218467 RepID=UPI000C6CD7E1|nr:E3 ubiquitin-protein ligase sina-like [Centruroides sculpturatus]